MATTFDRFRELPRELRDQMWKFAIRTSQPGEHIFRICNTFKDRYTGARDLASRFRAFPKHRFAERLERRCFDRIDANFSKKTVSTYLLDGGLWTACKESRLIMEKHFRSSEWDHWRRHRTREWHPTDTPGGFDMPATGYFSPSGGRPHLCTVLPHQDLFVLQPACLETLEWDRINRDIPIGSTKKGFNGLEHIAIEYNTKWAAQSRGATRYEELRPALLKLFVFSGFFGIFGKLWIIDHSLKQKKDASVFEENTSGVNTNAFYASDRKFLEVKWESSLDDWECAKQEDYYDSSISLLRLMDTVLKMYEPRWFGLLGWDDL